MKIQIALDDDLYAKGITEAINEFFYSRSDLDRTRKESILEKLKENISVEIECIKLSS